MTLEREAKNTQNFKELKEVVIEIAKTLDSLCGVENEIEKMEVVHEKDFNYNIWKMRGIKDV